MGHILTYLYKCSIIGSLLEQWNIPLVLGPVSTSEVYPGGSLHLELVLTLYSVIRSGVKVCIFCASYVQYFE